MTHGKLFAFCLCLLPAQVLAEAETAPESIRWLSHGEAAGDARLKTVQVHRGPAVRPAPSQPNPPEPTVSDILAQQARAAQGAGSRSGRHVYTGVRLHRPHGYRPRARARLKLGDGVSVSVTIFGDWVYVIPHAHGFGHPERPHKPKPGYRYPRLGKYKK